MFGGKKIRIDAATWKTLERVSRAAGYASVEECVRHILERETERILGAAGSGAATGGSAASEAEDAAAVKKRLEGLGYLG
ncbi:MAG: hypothetical protein HY720_23665 [Planctomycetes bacterium]|nr:hypothetical protein [Planctomycetota bacterium]